MDTKEEQGVFIKKLRDYFAAREDVVMAFLFGSRAKGTARRASDWDIAVYLTVENRNREQKIWSDIEEMLGMEADLVVLNRAPASLVWTVLRTGHTLALKDRHQYLRLLRSASHDANAWYDTAARYHRVFERSASLSCEDREQLERIVDFLSQEVSDWSKFQGLSWQDYQNDRAKKREVERWIEQIINAVIDASGIVLASERRVIPETYRLMVRALSAVPPFDGDAILYERIAEWTGLRNVLAHEYLDYRWKEIEQFIERAEPFFQKFIGALKTFLTQAENTESRT